MNITITINNPTAAVLKALGQAVPDTHAEFAGILAKVFDSDTPAQAGTGQPDANADAAATTNKITSDDLDALNVGDRIHWRGAKFEFDGTVLEIDGIATGDDKAVFVRREDNGKKVSLTADDLDNHSLTIIN